MKRKYREAMRAADALKHYDERQTLYPPKPPGPMGEPWRYEMTEQEQQDQARRIKEFNLPF